MSEPYETAYDAMKGMEDFHDGVKVLCEQHHIEEVVYVASSLHLADGRTCGCAVVASVCDFDGEVPMLIWGAHKASQLSWPDFVAAVTEMATKIQANKKKETDETD